MSCTLLNESTEYINFFHIDWEDHFLSFARNMEGRRLTWGLIRIEQTG